MDNIEKKLIMPDGSEVRYYIDKKFGIKTLNIDDVMEILKGGEENKQFLISKMGDFTQSTYIPPAPKPKQKLSEFNKKLQQGLNFNPKEK